MNILQATSTCLRKFSCFSGRAPRSEFWWWGVAYMLYMAVFCAIIVALDHVAPRLAEWLSAAAFILNLVLYVPGLAVASRRLHDIGKSGWWQLLAWIPLVGPVVLLIWFVRRSDPEANRFGPNPFVPSVTPAAPILA